MLKKLRRALIPTILLCSGVHIHANASIFRIAGKWPEKYAKGIEPIKVCIVKGSSANQRADGSQRGFTHQTNPTLEEVVAQVQIALMSSWSAHSPIRFDGYGPKISDLFKVFPKIKLPELPTSVGNARVFIACPPEIPHDTIALYISPDTDNTSQVGYNKPHEGSNFVNIRPWGRTRECISYNSAKARMEYRFDCARQYAIHEFGHRLGFAHEMQHPLAPSTCSNEKNVRLSAADGNYLVINPNHYDFESIMAYDKDCANVTGVRFGSPDLSPVDIKGLQSAYPKYPY